MAAGSTTLIVDGLPADLDDRIVTRLSLYFSNRRRSGGEVSRVLADPSHRKRALLVYDVDDGGKGVKSCNGVVMDHKAVVNVLLLFSSPYSSEQGFAERDPPGGP